MRTTNQQVRRPPGPVLACNFQSDCEGHAVIASSTTVETRLIDLARSAECQREPLRASLTRLAGEKTGAIKPEDGPGRGIRGSVREHVIDLAQVERQEIPIGG